MCGYFSHQKLKTRIFCPCTCGQGLKWKPSRDFLYVLKKRLVSEEKNYLTEQNSGLWAATNLTRHGSGFPLLTTFGSKLFLLIWYLHISNVACLRFLNSVGFLPSRFFLFYTRTEEWDGQIKSIPVDLNNTLYSPSGLCEWSENYTK